MTAPGPTSARELGDRFASVDPTYGPVPIWWWSGARLDRTRLRWQMEQLIAGGVRQAVIMCLAPRGPLYGSLADDPPFFSPAWWEIFLGACEDASSLGFRFWLYDQLGFSGANFQGQLTAADPSWAGQELERLQVTVGHGETVRLRAPAGSVPIGAYRVGVDDAAGNAPQLITLRGDGTLTYTGDAGRVCLAYAQTRGFDYYDADACAGLIDTVLGEFHRRAQKWFGPVIVGLFQDELPHLPTWGKEFADTFGVDHDYDLRARVAFLWEGDSTAAADVRRDYHAHRCELARTSFFRPYAAWANDADLVAGFDQQTPAREGDPVGTVGLYGDYLATHAGFTAPGSDHWGDPKLHSSLAHANGAPRTWIEAFHSSGWGGTLEETYDWLGPFLRRGANLYDPHAVYYSTASGWWEWAAPSTCWRQPYWPDYRIFSDAISRLCSLISSGELVASTVLLYPTSSVQADLPIDGAGDAARRASAVYHEINGSTTWFDERPGVLDRARVDYEILDETGLLAGDTDVKIWRAAGGAFDNIVLPAVTTMSGELADRLAAFAASGGTVVCVDAAPERFVGGDAARFRAAVDSGAIRVIPRAGDLPAALRSGSVVVRSDAPYMLRRYGDAWLLLLVAHDEHTGTQLTVSDELTIEARLAGDFSWERYWQSYSETGYTFVPVGDRRAQVQISGLADHVAQQWDPRTGRRTDLDVSRAADGTITAEVPFSSGTFSVVVLATDPPAANAAPRGQVAGSVPLDQWSLRAHSTLDNRWGDLGDAAVREVLPTQIWRVEHATGTGDHPPATGWRPTVATYGPYLRVRGPQPDCAGPAGADGWTPLEISLSRGIRKDPRHFATLGPKGLVPEEFVRCGDVEPGQWVAVATSIGLPDGRGRSLVVGAEARRRVFLDNLEADVEGTGYWTTTSLPDDAGAVGIELWLQAPPSGAATELRASFAAVTDVAAFRRPEWLEPASWPGTPSTVRFRTAVTLDEVPPNPVVQVGSEGPCSIMVNGVEVGRQGAFEPYWARRRPQVMPYHLGALLRPGRNEIVVQIDDLGDNVTTLLDSLPTADGGLGIVSDLDWSVTRDDVEVPMALRRRQHLDPRWACLYARPHPLPRAAWLDPNSASNGVVLDLVPDAGPADDRIEWLRFPAPVGTTAIRASSDLPVAVVVGDRDIETTDGAVTFDEPLPTGSVVALRFDATGGHRAGGLLRGPIEVELDRAPAPLQEWEQLGLRSLGGYVSYRTAVDIDPLHDGERLELDLGEVRGSVDVLVDDAPAATLVWSPYRCDLTDHLSVGRHDIEVIVRGTLAGYLDDWSPTPAVGRGQTRHGLLGPVRVNRLRPRKSP